MTPGPEPAPESPDRAAATTAAAHPGDPFAHPALFYRDSDEYLTTTLDFIRAGLDGGEPVAVSVPTGNLALLRAELGPDADAVRLLDMTVAGRNPGRIIPGVLRAFADAHPADRVRIVGEPIWPGRSALEYPACVLHEALVNSAFAGRAVTILCAYDTSALTPEILADAHATHPTLIDGGGESASTAYDPGAMVAAYNRPPPAPPATATVLAFDAAALTAVRHRAVEVARDAGMTGDRLIDLELVVAETTTNSVVHGGGQGTLALWAEDAQFCCQISDAGHIADPLAGRLPAAPRTAGGRGLLIVNELADLVRRYTGADGTTLHIRLPLA
ncbi:sensor histidine kinase [Nocardia acididurans]|uniref:sensor histidine kinase n=1 Tax=Nocardia acididurans TaxID=2802282 RepID=UPI0027DBB496|nr:sensor histidine kinase [Nocardia acididurans]